MGILFLKFSILVIGVLILLVLAKLFITPLTRFWSQKKRVEKLQHFIHANTFDKQTVLRAAATYVPPRFQEIPPTLRLPKKRRFRIKRKNLLKTLDFFLDQPVRCPHLLILADSGMGKTTLALNYYLHNDTRPADERHRIAVIPLGLQDADQRIQSVPDKAGTVLFLDGLDEDPAAVTDPRKRLRDLMDMARDFRRFIITGSILFIPGLNRATTSKGYVVLDKDADRPKYQLRRFFLSPMGDAAATKVLNIGRSFLKDRLDKEDLALIKSNATFSVTPLMLRYLPDDIPDNFHLLSKYEMYDTIVEGQIRSESNWKNKAELKRFLNLLARDLFLERADRKAEAIPGNELEQKASDLGIPLRPFRQEVPALMSHTRSNTLRFAHRSFLEFLFIRQLMTGDRACYQLLLTDLMKEFFFDALESRSSVHLKVEWQWLSQFGIKVQGIKPKGNMFRFVLEKKPSYQFLNRLTHLFKNPIFYEFGWDEILHNKLKKARYQGKTSLMRVERKKLTVMINPNTIEITKGHQNLEKIVFNQQEFEDYGNLKNDIPLVRLNRAVGLKGLRILHTINQSDQVCTLPDLKTGRTYTVYFRESA